MPGVVIARSAQRDEAISAPRGRAQVKRDCFAEPVIGPAKGRTRWLAMTAAAQIPNSITVGFVTLHPRTCYSITLLAWTTAASLHCSSGWGAHGAVESGPDGFSAGASSQPSTRG